jgi:hypothetical protein
VCPYTKSKCDFDDFVACPCQPTPQKNTNRKSITGTLKTEYPHSLSRSRKTACIMDKAKNQKITDFKPEENSGGRSRI